MHGLHTTESLADYLQVSPHTVRREREAGRLPYIRIRDLVRYHPEDVEMYLQTQSEDRRPATAESFGENAATGR